MTVAYDYFWISTMLCKAGARSDLNNEEGNASGAGIDGDKAEWAKDFVSAVCDAGTTAEAVQALGWLRDAIAGGATVDKAALAKRQAEEAAFAKRTGLTPQQARCCASRHTVT